MTLPPLHHGRNDDDPRLRPGRGGAGGPGNGLRTASTFVGVTFACALIGFWALRLVGIGRGDLSLGWALAIVAGAGVVAAVVTRAVGRR